jgi:hypothetical protein
LPVVELAADDARPDRNWMLGAVFRTTLGVVLAKHQAFACVFLPNSCGGGLRVA